MLKKENHIVYEESEIIIQPGIDMTVSEITKNVELPRRAIQRISSLVQSCKVAIIYVDVQ